MKTKPRIYSEQRNGDPFCGIGLGDIVMDEITGFRGTITGQVSYLSGCNQCLVVPQGLSDRMNPSEWIDIERLTLIETSTVDVSPRNAGHDLLPPKR